ncbi:hypothetical protein D6825_01850 [Candidatus Woesearchaeota archaeon]|nr:MAG: hypothetical protein D6825_01850 [Candidatus Woesearchaeota archaeon]
MKLRTKTLLKILAIVMLLSLAGCWKLFAGAPPQTEEEKELLKLLEGKEGKISTEAEGKIKGSESTSEGALEKPEDEKILLPGGPTARDIINEERKKLGLPEETKPQIAIPGYSTVGFDMIGSSEFDMRFDNQEGIFFGGVPIISVTPDGTVYVGDDDDSLHMFEDDFDTSEPILENDYFIVSDCTFSGSIEGDNTCFTHVFRFDSLDPTQHVLILTDLGVGTRSVTFDAKTGEGKIVAGGVEYKFRVKKDSSTGEFVPQIAVDLNGNGKFDSCSQILIGLPGDIMLGLFNTGIVGGRVIPTTSPCGTTAAKELKFSLKTLQKEFDDSDKTETVEGKITVTDENQVTIRPDDISASSTGFFGMFQNSENSRISQGVSSYGHYFETYDTGRADGPEDLNELSIAVARAQIGPQVVIAGTPSKIPQEAFPPRDLDTGTPSIPGAQRMSTEDLFQEGYVNEYVPISSPSDLLEFGERIGEVRDTITPVELPTLLSGGQVVTREGSTEVNQWLRFPLESDFGTSGSVRFLEDERDRTSNFLFWESGSTIFEWQLEFEEGLESRVDSSGSLRDLIDEDISILGQNFVVPVATVRMIDSKTQEVEIQFMGGAISAILGENDKQTFTAKDGRTYDVEVVAISERAGTTKGREGSVKLRVNGEITPELFEGETTVLSDGAQLGIRAITPTGKNVQKSLVQIFLGGAYNVRFKDSNASDDKFETGQTRVNQEDVEDGLVRIRGQFIDNTTYEIRDITYKLKANAVLGDIYVPAGQGVRAQLQEPEAMLTPNWDILYLGVGSQVSLPERASPR